jgi:hypothetical protein
VRIIKTQIMNIENEYKEFNDYWNETIKGDNWTTLERQACFMGWMEAKKRALNLYNVVQQSEPLKCDQVCDWYSVGHQLNGHQECRTCGKQKAF